MLKPGVNSHPLGSNLELFKTNNKIHEINDYCKSERINLAHYIYLLDAHKETSKIKNKNILLPISSLVLISLFISFLYIIN
ncbi:hypothetical protein CLHOM_02060 [Clostridium homopropionicum DSM 5847]|uniref:Uncharacterized protein n=1 Tax=Clostridium homopropionicum DSM 5847 TaxID=1121318 RepID=A0A0L6ZEY4_9CLOT|nr:hypothetical protein [Clostridium homopropionicum]KOA21535.1 hypothetical protein CLHOM_02060 [Clostridium homopropionicum DSM 5847]SFG06589.1 hypothetical protein SAMN04488501_10514 [Clostridium homopropionicum]